MFHVERNYPSHWLRGQLLDHQLFDNGKSRCILLHDSADKPEYLGFDSREDAQSFISWWYAPASARQQERECQNPVQSDARVSMTPKS